MPPEEHHDRDDFATMSFGDHLEDLRRRLILALVGLVPIFAAALIVSRGVLDYLLVPAQEQLRRHQLPAFLQATGPVETFGSYVRVALVLTVLVGAPWVLYQFWLFVAPGLLPRERRFAYFLVPLSAVLMFAGVAFLYRILLPLILSFFITFGSEIGVRKVPAGPLPEGVVLPSAPLLDHDPVAPEPGTFWINTRLSELRIAAGGDGGPSVLSAPLTRSGGISQQYRVSEYVKLLFQLALAFAIGFQTPIVVMLLAWSGILTLEYMASRRKYVVLICTIAGAMLTPADPISMILLAVPLYLLYELGMIMARFITPRRIAAGLKGDE
jgi:sec-independent protein translocase protein TatC